MRCYEDVTSHRKRSVLPPELQRSIARMCESIGVGHVDPYGLTSIIFGLSQLPAEAYLQAAREIADIGRLYRWHEPARFFLHIFHAQSESDLLSKTPNLEYLYLFHGNGYLRERALAKINGPIKSAFYFNSIAYRLNDWVGPVRQAAQACAARTFPGTSPDIIAEAAFVLLERMRHWQRWSEAASILEETFSRADVTDRLAQLMMTAIVGSPSRVLRFALCHDRMDRHLLDLSRRSVQPSVRALALKTLIQGKATWPEGYAKKWVDKSMGLSKRIVAYGERQLNRPVSVDSLIAQGMADKSAMVRRIAADALVQYRKSLNNLDELVQRCASDKNSSVRERALFILHENENRPSE